MEDDRLLPHVELNSSTSAWFQFKSMLWILSIVFSLFGVQFIYSIEFALGTPFFISKMKLSDSTTNIIMATIPPFAGLFVQPIIGVLSDRCMFRLGRRRPFILIGSITSAIGMGLLGNSLRLGSLFDEDEDSEDASDHFYGLIFALGGFLLVNIGLNITHGPARALVSEITLSYSHEIQNRADFVLSVLMGVSAVVANITGAQFFTKVDHPYQYVFSLGGVVSIISSIPTLLIGHEKPLNSDSYIPRLKVIEVFGSLFRVFRTLPSSLSPILILFFLSWCSYTPLMINLTTFFGQIVYDGLPDDENEQKGVRSGQYALAMFSSVTFCYSFILPALIIRFQRIKLFYFLSQALATVSYFGFLLWDDYFHYQGFVFLLTGMVGPNFGSFNTIPHGLVSTLIPPNNVDHPFYLASLNVCSVLAQAISAGVVALLLHFKDVSWAIALGSVWSLMACVVVWGIEIPSFEFLPLSPKIKNRKKKKKRRKQRRNRDRNKNDPVNINSKETASSNSSSNSDQFATYRPSSYSSSPTSSHLSSEIVPSSEQPDEPVVQTSTLPNESYSPTKIRKKTSPVLLPHHIMPLQNTYKEDNDLSDVTEGDSNISDE